MVVKHRERKQGWLETGAGGERRAGVGSAHPTCSAAAGGSGVDAEERTDGGRRTADGLMSGPNAVHSGIFTASASVLTHCSVSLCAAILLSSLITIDLISRVL